MSFAAPLFLIAALAAAIPVVLHLINRQRAKALPFSTLRFLRLSVQKTRRRKRVHELLLMLLRAAVLLLIAVGLAKPTITHLGALWGGANTAVAVIVDNSASMGMIDQDRPRFETAAAAAGQILDELIEGDQAALFLTCGPDYSELGKLYHTQEQIRQVLAQAQVSYQRADLAIRIRQARALLADSSAAQKYIYVISDMQKISWENWKDNAPPAQAGGQKDAIAQENPSAAGHPNAPPADDEVRTIPVILIDCNRTPKPNDAVEALQLQTAVPVAHLPVKATVELLNTSSVAQQRVVELFVDDNKVSSSPELNIPPEGCVKHDFSFMFQSAGLHRVEVRLAGEDGSKYDDRRYAAVQIGQSVPVAIVKSQNHEIAYLDDAFYLKNAFSPDPSGKWAINAAALMAGDLPNEPLSNYNVIFCVNLPALNEEAAQRLRSYVLNGGNLVWIAGDNVDPAAYNEMNEQAGGQLLPAPLAEIRTPGAEDNRDSWHVGFLDKQYPAFGNLVEPASLYESVLVYKHVRMAPVEGEAVAVLARLDDGEPLLLSRDQGAGRVLMLGTGVRLDWTNLPLRPIFLPLIAQLTFALSRSEQFQHSLYAGAPLVLKFENAAQQISVEVFNPQGETTRQATNSAEGDKGQIFRYDDTYQIGVYLLRLLDTPRPTQIAYAVNFDPEEAEPAKITREELQNLFGQTPLLFADNPDDLSGTFHWLREGKSLWGLFLTAVLIVLVFESFVSNWLSPKQARDQG